MEGLILNGEIMNKIFGKFGITMFLIFLISNAFALVDNGQNDCSLLSIDAGMVSLEKSSEKTLQVSVHNSNGEPFYLEKLGTIDNVSGVMVSAHLGDKVILPFETKNFVVKVKTLENVALGKHFIVLQAKGHFLNGDSCGLEDLKTNLIVDIKESKQLFEETEKTYSCKDFVLTVPNSLVISNDEGINSVLMDIKNGLNEPVEIRVSGANLSFYSNKFLIPAKSKLQERIYFLAKKDKTFIILNMESKSCKFDSRIIEVTKEVNSDKFSSEEMEENQEEIVNQEKEEEMILVPGLGLISLTQAGLLVGFLVLIIVIMALLYIIVTERKAKAKTK